MKSQQPASTEAEASAMASPILSREKVEEMELALKKWCDEGLYKNSEVNIYSLASNLGYKKDELTQYFNQSQHTNFRTWLSVVRFEEACRILSSKSEFSLDAISSECGFSSHTQIYRVFKQQTGLSPRQWREQKK